MKLRIILLTFTIILSSFNIKVKKIENKRWKITELSSDEYLVTNIYFNSLTNEYSIIFKYKDIETSHVIGEYKFVGDNIIILSDGKSIIFEIHKLSKNKLIISVNNKKIIYSYDQTK